MNDSEFDDLLRTARSSEPLPPSFRHGVWHRIECAGTGRSSAGLAAWLESVASTLARPWAAAAAVAVTVTTGLWFGLASAPGPRDAKVAYAESISPFAHPPRK
jgi:hypothetical protein